MSIVTVSLRKTATHSQFSCRSIPIRMISLAAIRKMPALIVLYRSLRLAIRRPEAGSIRSALFVDHRCEGRPALAATRESSAPEFRY